MNIVNNGVLNVTTYYKSFKNNKKCKFENLTSNKTKGFRKYTRRKISDDLFVATWFKHRREGLERVASALNTTVLKVLQRYLFIKYYVPEFPDFEGAHPEYPGRLNRLRLLTKAYLNNNA